MSVRLLSKLRTQFAVRSSKILILAAYCALRTAHAVYAEPKLAPAHLEGQTVNDLSSPYNLQAVTLNQTVTLNWEWVPPDPGPAFQSFGYEVSRDDKVI